MAQSVVCSNKMFPVTKRNSAASGRDARPLRCPMFAYVVMSAVLLLGRMSAGHFLRARGRSRSALWCNPRQGLNVVLVVP